MGSPLRRRSSLSESLSSSPSATSRHASATAAAIAAAAQQKKLAALTRPSPLLRRASGLRLDRDLRFEVLFHLPGHADMERLLVHRSQSLVAMQAALQREFGVAFEQQRLYLHGEELEGDDELSDYGLQDQSVVIVRVSPRFRRIGDVYSTIRIVRFPSPVARPEDFQLVEVAAPLPPLRTVFQRLAHAIAYLTTLDRMQARHTRRRVWRQHVTFWDEPSVPQSSQHLDITTPSPRSRRVARPELGELPQRQPTEDRPPQSFVLQTTSTERVASVLALSRAHAVSQRLQRPPISRSVADLRHLKKWLGTLQYFANARLPDAVLQEIARTSSYVCARSGEFVFRQGEPGDCFYVLISGCVSLAAFGTGFFGTLTPGACFGEISLLEAQGTRTASASVTFAASAAELAVISGDLYRRAIKPYKQEVLRGTERALLAIPQLLTLPHSAITHLAYAAKLLTARTGKRIICRGEEVRVLVLLVRGTAKVSTPLTDGQRVVTVVHAPAVFGQEGALTPTASPAPWDLDALDSCSLLCLRKDTIASFLSPSQSVVRALLDEHQLRLRDFHHRFSTARADRELESALIRRLSLRVLDLPTDVHERTTSPTAVKKVSIAFPPILLRDEDVETQQLQISTTTVSDWDERVRPATTTPSGSTRQCKPAHARPSTRAGAASSSSPRCDEVEARFLSHALPFAHLLTLPEQLRFASFDQEQATCLSAPPQQGRSRHHRRHCDSTVDSTDEQSAEAKTTALVNGLRRLPAQDVRLLPVVCPASSNHTLSSCYRFACADPS